MLLEVDHIRMTYAVGGFFRRRDVKAVDDVSLRLEAGSPEILAIIGESGLRQDHARPHDPQSCRLPTAGTIRFLGADVTAIRSNRERMAFMRQVQPIFQNPFEAFNPLKPIDHYLFISARRFRGRAHAQRLRGQGRQGAASSRAVAGRGEGRATRTSCRAGNCSASPSRARWCPSPSLIVADEPVSMVDASLRMSIVNLFKTLRDELGVSIVYITHDLATAYYISDRVLIMQHGKAVESGDARAVLDNPQHPYSILLEKRRSVAGRCRQDGCHRPASARPASTSAHRDFKQRSESP